MDPRNKDGKRPSETQSVSQMKAKKDDRIRFGDAGLLGQLQDEPPRIRQVTGLARATDALRNDSAVIAVKARMSGHRRYVELCCQALFDRLVTLYTIQITAQLSRIGRYIESYTSGADLAAYAAQRYISCWFHDLYVSNRASVSRLTSIEFQKHYRYEDVYYLDEYDSFLSILNSHIRPTSIHGTMEDTLWIPLIHSEPDWNDRSNPFQIINYDADFSFARGLVEIMKDTESMHSKWITQRLSTDITGRPSWLFDWFTLPGIDRAFAWFPKEGNYTDEDVTVAYIIGVACTPKLGPRDVDDWQTWTNNTPPAQIQPKTLQRVVDRRWFGGAEVRTIEERILELYFLGPVPATPEPVTLSKNDDAGKAEATTLMAIETSTKGATAEGTTSTDTVELVEVNQFQITDWTYYANVIERAEYELSTEALGSINMNFS